MLESSAGLILKLQFLNSLRGIHEEVRGHSGATGEEKISVGGGSKEASMAFYLFLFFLGQFRSGVL